MTFFHLLAVIKIDAPCSVCPLPIAWPSSGLNVGESCFKIWVCRKYLSILCNSPCSSLVSGTIRAESLSYDSALGGGPLDESLRLQRRTWPKVTRPANQKQLLYVQRNKQTNTKNTCTDAATITHLCHPFTYYAGRSRLCVLWASLWQRAAGRHFPGSEAANVKSMSDCFTLTILCLTELVRINRGPYLNWDVGGRHLGVLGDVGPLHRGVCRHILQEKGCDMLMRKEVTLAIILWHWRIELKCFPAATWVSKA